MNKKGFTLIELLAVIVILAIIALIATPVVLDIINDTRESAQLRSAEFYLDAVEHSITKKMMDDPTFKPETCDISDGNLKCEDTEVKVEVKGEKPTSGTVDFKKGKITEVTLVLSEKTISKTPEGELINLKYQIGDKIIFNPGDQDRTWIVIGESKDTVTLMLNENLKDENGENINWISKEDYATYNNDGTKVCTSNGEPSICSDAALDEGPVTAFKKLNSVTSNWNIDVIDNYTYINNDGTTLDYKRIDIKNGVTTIIDDNGNENKIEGETKARLITLEEMIKIAQSKDKNYRESYILKEIQKLLDAQNRQMTANEFIELCIVEYNASREEILLLIYQDTLKRNFPDFLFENLDDDSNDIEYYLLSTVDVYYLYVASDKNIYSSDSKDYQKASIRPVIEISKDKLK